MTEINILVKGHIIGPERWNGRGYKRSTFRGYKRASSRGYNRCTAPSKRTITLKGLPMDTQRTFSQFCVFFLLVFKPASLEDSPVLWRKMLLGELMACLPQGDLCIRKPWNPYPNMNSLNFGQRCIQTKDAFQ